jgi:4-hydroxy-3-polyprenylbenzoate decarboxylase
VIGISGASGMRYARRLIDVLEAAGLELHLVISEAGLRVMAEEEGLKTSASQLSADALIGRESSRVKFYPSKDIGAAIASGSFKVAGMVICPCSMDTLASIATGVSMNLLQRAADVTIKERRPLILVPRETPLSAIHLENMLKLARLGVAIVPAMPGFYHSPKNIEELVDMQVMKITDQMGLALSLVKRWRAE